MISQEREIEPWIFYCGFGSVVSWITYRSLLVQGFSGTVINSYLFWVQCISIENLLSVITNIMIIKPGQRCILMESGYVSFCGEGSQMMGFDLITVL